MDLNYFKTQIEDEIEGCKDYLYKAIEIKPMNESWAKIFVEMSDAEKEHAINLYSMMGSYYNKLQNGYKSTPKYMEKVVNETTIYFNESIDCISKLEATYEKV